MAEAHGSLFSGYSIQDAEGIDCGFLVADYKRLPAVIPVVELILLSECGSSADDYIIERSRSIGRSKGYWVMLITWIGPAAERRVVGGIQAGALNFAQTIEWKQITLG